MFSSSAAPACSAWLIRLPIVLPIAISARANSFTVAYTCVAIQESSSPSS